ncbi:hypothetical protein GCM10009718_33100 [Isoptericola halotolerans]|uniref:Uncharacterized protein n=1 Tax=Isoptericola halotolerans TaxID=300560 RepID=A0ABX2A5V4_9MICO|nr:hypothetical protein [Isoptericola halotolerans]NOV98198.1 hypothetical protein [Isoptericola halotolerans]
MTDFREALACAIAPSLVDRQNRLDKALSQLDVLGLTDDEKRQALDATTKLAASGALHEPELVYVLCRIAAQGCITDADLAALEHAGIKDRTHGRSTR